MGASLSEGSRIAAEATLRQRR
ncbi:hypothetical protein DF3PB_1800010 [uncultured Defluviicoccus sp.]|uniref:Uncharacterized protein n=1 Tax=metagenome TaxID=256318 RepID=A0A380TAY4_9ZZZZ|nr:hypothetical protein DF3PB_1800010 [uncultured Defluviicoccus sp.]